MSDAVNVPVQVRASVLGIPIVNTQQVAHKSSLDVQTLDANGNPSSQGQAQTSAPQSPTSAVRLLNNLTLDSVGLRVDLESAAWAKTPGATETGTTGTANAGTAGTGTTGGGTAIATDSLAHASLSGSTETVVRLGPLNTEIVSLTGRNLASTADIAGSCGALKPSSNVDLGTTSLRVLGREVALPANPAPNTKVPLENIPGLVSGTLVLNEQTSTGDGSTLQVVAVAPVRLQLQLSLAGLSGLADVDVSVAGNSAAVNCSPNEPEKSTPTTQVPPAPSSPSATTPSSSSGTPSTASQPK